MKLWPFDLVHDKSTIGERLAIVRAQREKAAERVVACLSATRKANSISRLSAI